ncbi:MAG: phosphotransferase [Jhaorihella sp.]
MTADCPPELIAGLTEQAQAGGADTPRIERLELAGRVFWVKRVERPGLRMRVQKGDPRRALGAERRALHVLHAAGAPVPPVCAEGPGFFVTPDCGRSVAMIQRGGGDPAGRAAALREAGRTLGRLHALGFSHGRPSPKDMCLHEGRVTLVDFENFRPRLNTPEGHARDLVVFVFNVLVNAPDDAPEVHDALAGHGETAPPGIRPLASAWCRRMAWAGWLTWPVRRFSGAGRAREFKAIPRTLALFRDG